MALTDDELILLDTLIYFDGVVREGDSVRDIIDKVNESLNTWDGVESLPGCMNEGEWRQIVENIADDSKLLSYKVGNYTDGDINKGRIACFVDNTAKPTDVNVIFKGTGGGYEWDDNGEGAYLIESDCQKAAADYVNSLPQEYGNNIVVSGHSKGGNKAQYVTIVTDRVSRCVSADGQGFSVEFTDRYAEEIAEKRNRIKNICASGDYVNIIGTTIAGEVIYIETGFQFLPMYHKSNILLDSDGKLNPQTEQAEWAGSIQEYLNYVLENLEEPQKSYVIDGFIALLEFGVGGSDWRDNIDEGWIQRAISVLSAVGFWLAWVIEKKEWFGIASEWVSEFIQKLTSYLSPSKYYDLSCFSVNTGGLYQLYDNALGYERKLNDLAVRIENARNGLKGMSYANMRFTLSLLEHRLEGEAKSCHKLAKAVNAVCIDYDETEKHVIGLYE